MAELALQTTLHIKTTECFVCGCMIGMVADFYDYRVRDHKNFYCPNGHPQHFIGESDVERAQRLLREEQERHKRTLARANEAEAEREKIAKQRDNLKKRVKAGVCPCCKRTFKQLAAHMMQKHPDYDISFGKRKLP